MRCGSTRVIQYLGLWILIALTLNMWALISVMRSDARWLTRLLWAIPLLLLPGAGFVAWYLLGPRQRVT